MYQPTSALIFSVLFMPVGVISGIVGISIGGRWGSLLWKQTQSTLLFRRRFSGRLGAFIFGSSFLVFPICLLFDVINTHSLPTAGLFPLFFLSCGWISIGALLIYLAGPNDIYLDLDHRTYQVTYGWPINSKVRSGTFEDITGIYVCERAGRAGGYMILIRWQNVLHKGGMLGKFEHREEAEQMAEDLAENVGVLKCDSDVTTR